MEENTNYFTELMKVKCQVEQKLGANYISWADAWAGLKQVHPFATFKVHEDEKGMPYFADETGCFVKVSVTIPGDTIMTHTSLLPIFSDKAKDKLRYPPIKKEELTSMDINKSIQRALTKAIALHGVGLYVFKGENLPEDSKETVEPTISAKTPSEPQKTPGQEQNEFHLICSNCGKDVTQKVYDYSMNLYKACLCFG